MQSIDVNLLKDWLYILTIFCVLYQLMSIWDLFQALLFSKGSHNNCDLRESLMFYGVFRSLGAHNEMWLSVNLLPWGK